MTNTVDDSWQMPPQTLVPSAEEVHLWRMALTLESQAATACLSSDEQARANRFKFERDQRRFTASRTHLRSILAKYLNCEPAALQFEYQPYGKPYLSTAPTLQFNLSHSGDLALCAVTQNHRVGVDLEQLRPLSHFQGLSQRCLSAFETKAIQKLPESEQPLTFLQYWTCKEAYLKAIGQGLSQSLQTVEVSLAPRAELCQVPEPGQWQLQPVNPGPGYVAAVVVEAITRFSYFNWTG